jgi:Flp pilus assembly protein TadD
LGFPLFVVLVFSTNASGQHALHSIPSIPQELLERPVTIRTGVGTVHDDAATKNAEAQRFYDQGLAYLHNYVWIEAARSFHQALRLDSQLALAHVGLSYAYIELNKTAQSRQAITTAQKLAANAGDHIKRHVEARALQMRRKMRPAMLEARISQVTGRCNRRLSQRRRVPAAPRIAESPDPADRGRGRCRVDSVYERA